jgi:hypothetical protein
LNLEEDNKKATVEELLRTIIQGHNDKIDLIMLLFGFYPYEEHCDNYDSKIKKAFANYEKLKKNIFGSRQLPP